MKEKPAKIIVILGPTASGKSDLAIKLARRFNGEIISADSRQVYRGLDIGTGKVSKREQRLVPHHLIDVANPNKQFSAAQFKSRASRAISDITRRGKLPIICGGTGLYIDALVYDLNLPEVPPDKKLRAKLSRFASRGARLANRGSSISYQNHKLILEKSGEITEVDVLFSILTKLDPRRAKTVDPHNQVRLIRAIEIARTLGQVPEMSTDYSSLKSKYDILWLGLNPKDLDKRISSRLKKRFKQGMVAEIKKLRRSGVSWKRLYDLGLEYRWLGQYLQGKISKQEMETGLLTDIRRYAKRQITWFKRNKNIRWIRGAKEATPLCRDFLR